MRFFALISKIILIAEVSDDIKVVNRHTTTTILRPVWTSM